MTKLLTLVAFAALATACTSPMARQATGDSSPLFNAMQQQADNTAYSKQAK